MKIFNYSPEELKEMKAVFTATEIHQQPDTWEKPLAQIGSMKEEIRTFLAKILDQPD